MLKVGGHQCPFLLHSSYYSPLLLLLLLLWFFSSFLLWFGFGRFSNSEQFVAETEMKVFEFGILQSSLKPILTPKLGIFLDGLREQDGFQIPTSPQLVIEDKEEEEARPCSQSLDFSKIEEFQEEEDGFRTPTSFEHKITEFQNCPPPPKKPKSESKRRASDLCYSIVDSEDLELIFRPIVIGFSSNSGQKIKKARTEKIG